MATPTPEPAQLLVTLLETLAPAQRQQIMTWLLSQGHGQPGVFGPHGWPTGDPEQQRRRLASVLPVGEDSQLVTIRLPTERHAELRDWCAEHGFTMAAVVRGLVERFLEQQRPA